MVFTTTEVLWDAIGTSREYLAKLTVPCTKWDLPPVHGICTCLCCENGEMDEIYLQKVLSSIQIVFPTIERRLERQISQMRASRKAAVQSFEARKHFNRTLPINQLPFEIFLMIVEVFLHDELFQGSYHRDLGRIRLVCSSWDARILQHPRVWRFIPAQYSPEAIDKYLERSKSIPLSVWYSTDHTQLVRRLPEVILGESSRWRSIDISSDQPEDFHLLANAPVPQLGVLELTCFGPMASGEQEDPSGSLDLFGGEAPRLRKIIIRELSLRWDSGIFRGIEELVLEEVRGISITQLTKILHQSPTLKVLRLQSCWLTEQPAAGSVITQTIALPHLRSLSLLQLPRTVTSCLLQHLDTPGVEKFIISPVSSTGEDPNALLQAVTTFIGRARELVSRLRCMQLSIDATELSGWMTINAGVDSRNQTFTLESIFGPPAKWTTWVRDHILSSLSDKAEVDLVLEGTISTDVISRIDRAQSIRSLKIFATRMPDRTLEYLGRPVAAREISGSSNQYWPFSSVTSMTFDGNDCDLGVILSMLKGRYGTSDAHTSGGIPEDQLSDRQVQLESELKKGIPSGADNRANRSHHSLRPSPLRLLQLPMHPGSTIPTMMSRFITTMSLHQIKKTVGDEVLKFETCQPLLR